MPTVRWAEPMPAQHTSERSGAMPTRGVDRLDDLLGVGHVGVDVDPADLLREGLALVVLQVGDHDADAVAGEQPAGRGAEPGGATGDNC